MSLAHDVKVAELLRRLPRPADVAARAAMVEPGVRAPQGLLTSDRLGVAALAAISGGLIDLRVIESPLEDPAASLRGGRS